MEATKVLNDDFYVPNRAQLMLNFLQKHGDRIVQETPGPKRRFPIRLPACSACLAEIFRSSTVIAVRHVRTIIRNQIFPSKEEVCMCVCSP